MAGLEKFTSKTPLASRPSLAIVFRTAGDIFFSLVTGPFSRVHVGFRFLTGNAQEMEEKGQANEKYLWHRRKPVGVEGQQT